MKISKNIYGVISRLSVIVLCVFSFQANVVAQDVSGQKRQKAELERDIAILDSQLKANKAKSNTALADLSLIQRKISARKKLLDESNRQIQAIGNKIYLKQHRINELNKRIDTLSFYYAKLLRNAYKNRDVKVWYMYILASDNLGQALRRMGYLKNISSSMNEQAIKINEAKEELEGQKAALRELQKKEQVERSKRQMDLDRLKAEEIAAGKLVKDLRRNQRRYSQQLSKKRKQVQALNREIQRIINEAMTPKSKEKKTEIDYKLDKRFASNKGKLPWPADGPVTEHFGQRYHPVFKRVKLPFNNGMSISLRKGDSVRAIFDGEVKQIVVMPGYNTCVLIRHGNFFSFYCKLKKAFVKAGDKVKTGDVIGIVDTINDETQLHFQIWEGKKPQNPEKWLRR